MPADISSDTLAKLRQYDTPTICNVIELFEVRPQYEGYMDGRITSAFPELPPMVGFAATAAFRAAEPPRGADVYGGLGDQLRQFEELHGPAVVVFQDLDDPPVAATFGEVMCSTYRAFGAAGLVTSGGGRDLEQVHAIQFPVFTSGTICSHAYSHTLRVAAPVRVGGLMVHTGDLIHGDANGVTNIPPDIAHDVAEVSAQFIAAEAHVIDYCQAEGEKNLSEYEDRLAKMRDEIAGLRRGVSRKSN